MEEEILVFHILFCHFYNILFAILFYIFFLLNENEENCFTNTHTQPRRTMIKHVFNFPILYFHWMKMKVYRKEGKENSATFSQCLICCIQSSNIDCMKIFCYNSLNDMKNLPVFFILLWKSLFFCLCFLISFFFSSAE